MSCWHPDNGGNVKFIACSEVFLTSCQLNTHWHTWTAPASSQALKKSCTNKLRLLNTDLRGALITAFIVGYGPFYLFCCWRAARECSQVLTWWARQKRGGSLAGTDIPESDWIGNSAANKCDRQSRPDRKWRVWQHQQQEIIVGTIWNDDS